MRSRPYGFHVPRPLTIALGLAVLVWWLRGRVHHVVVTGGSMLPTLAPGDRLLLLRTTTRPRPGQLALAPDPRGPSRLLLKRVHRVADGLVELRGDNPAASTDSRQFGTVPAGDVVACAAWRYAPPGRTGRISLPRAPAGRPAGRPPGRR